MTDKLSHYANDQFPTTHRYITKFGNVRNCSVTIGNNFDRWRPYRHKRFLPLGTAKILEGKIICV
jgi:hypothetical protein